MLHTIKKSHVSIGKVVVDSGVVTDVVTVESVVVVVVSRTENKHSTVAQFPTPK